MTDRNAWGFPATNDERLLPVADGQDTPERVEYLLRVDRTNGGMLMMAQAPIADANFRMVFQGTTLIKGEQIEPVPQ